MRKILEVSSDLNELLLSVHHTQIIEKGTFLFQEGTPSHELYIIRSGKVRISKITPDGRELTLRLCGQGDLIGELTLFNPSQRNIQSGKVIESGEVAVIYQMSLEEKLAKNPALALEFMKWMSLQNQKAQTRFRDLVLNGKKGAMYSTLIRLANSFGERNNNGITISLNVTNQELANFCGTSREVVNRFLSELRKNGIISVNKGVITINDLNYLKMEIDCENCPIEICNIS
jgi:CRP-like cAMP-binding protein